MIAIPSATSEVGNADPEAAYARHHVAVVTGRSEWIYLWLLSDEDAAIYKQPILTEWQQADTGQSRSAHQLLIPLGGAPSAAQAGRKPEDPILEICPDGRPVGANRHEPREKTSPASIEEKPPPGQSD